MNAYLAVILLLLAADYVLEFVVNALNISRAGTTVPGEFEGWYDRDRYAKAQDYLKDRTRLDLVSDTILFALTVGFILLGGFRVCDELARAAGFSMIGTGVLFGALLILLSQVVRLPFAVYDTFVVEERYGFNRTTPRTFAADQVKGLLLAWGLGGAVFAAVLWFFAYAGPWAWVWSWVAITVFQLVLTYVAPVVILPLFNKFIPIEDGPLRKAIEDYVAGQGFRVGGIFSMDGSRRSSKSNAYFTGFGRWRRIVLFDTLIEKHSEGELVAVLAHEVGHYKLRHIPKHLALSIASTALLFYLLSIFVSRPGLYQAFGVGTEPIGGQFPLYAGMAFFGFLYSPISRFIGLVQGMISRRHEYEADGYAARTTDGPESLVEALKRLSVENLSNLTPHPLKVFVEYSHPPVLERIKALRRTDVCS
jgi:STE24 endopeptidase